MIQGLKKIYIKHPTQSLVFSFLVAYLVPRISTFLVHGPFSEPDTGGYRTFSNNFGFTNDLAKVSILGNSFRPFPVNLIYAIMPNDNFRVISQIILGAFSWSIFIILMSKDRRPHWVTFAFAIIFTLVPGMVYRDLALLPDSISLSFFILIFSIIVCGRTKSIPTRILIFILTAMLVIQRPTIWIATFLLGMAFGIISIKLRSKVFLCLTSLCLIVSIFGFSYNQKQSLHGWPKYFQTEYPVTKNAFPIGLLIWKDNVLHNDWSKALKESDYPECGDILSKDPGPWEYSVRVFGNCKEASFWLSTNFYKFYLDTLIHHPRLFINQIATEFPKAFVPTPDPFVFEKISSVGWIPKIPSFDLIGLSKYSGLNYILSNNPLVFWSPIFLFLLIFNRRNIDLSKRNFYLLISVSFALAINIFANNIVMPSDTFRHNLPSNFGIFLMSYWFVTNIKRSSE